MTLLCAGMEMKIKGKCWTRMLKPSGLTAEFSGDRLSITLHQRVAIVRCNDLVRRESSGFTDCSCRLALTDRTQHNVTSMPQLRGENGQERSLSPSAPNLTPTCLSRGAMPPPLFSNLGVAPTETALTHPLRRITFRISGCEPCYAYYKPTLSVRCIRVVVRRLPKSLLLS
jgi:hypothetical protein